MKLLFVVLKKSRFCWNSPVKVCEIVPLNSNVFTDQFFAIPDLAHRSAAPSVIRKSFTSNAKSHNSTVARWNSFSVTKWIWDCSCFFTSSFFLNHSKITKLLQKIFQIQVLTVKQKSKPYILTFPVNEQNETVNC